jgi:glycosyltransferase involved in cell wall biosynthesis
MIEQSLRILQVSTFDTIGGAEKVAWNLFQAYRARGYGSWLAVGHKLGNDADVWVIPNSGLHGRWTRFWWGLHSHLQSQQRQSQAVLRLGGLAQALAEPGRALDHHRGIEDFHFPGTWQLLKLAGPWPDIVHCHNLHGEYFDLRALPYLSQQVPMVVTLHDAWLLSGHCAHSLDCERWKTGCGHCPDLTIDPAIQRDATAYNWQRKREIYRKSRLYIATPSRWLMQKVEQSMLITGVIEARVIPNGVDISIFHPADKGTVRATLDIPQNAKVLLFAATAVRKNMWKDYQTVRMAVALAAEHLDGHEVLFIALGEDAPAERTGQAEVRFVPYQNNPEDIARYYQAADVYAHAARADTFPNTVLEALACGTPVVATAVGGIPEQIDEGRTGFLVPAGDAEAMANRLVQLLSDNELRQRMGIQAADAAWRRFDLHRRADTYLEWYEQLVNHRALLAHRQEVACIAQP